MTIQQIIRDYKQAYGETWQSELLAEYKRLLHSGRLLHDDELFIRLVGDFLVACMERVGDEVAADIPVIGGEGKRPPVQSAGGGAYNRHDWPVQDAIYEARVKRAEAGY